MTSVKSELQQQTSQLAESKSALATYEEQLVELKTNLASAEACLVSQTMGNESANEKVCSDVPLISACFTMTYVNIDVTQDMASTTHSYSYRIGCYQLGMGLLLVVDGFIFINLSNNIILYMAVVQ